MNSTIVQNFLSEDCTEYVCKLLLEEISRNDKTKAEFNFNMFDVIFEFESNHVSIYRVVLQGYDDDITILIEELKERLANKLILMK